MKMLRLPQSRDYGAEGLLGRPALLRPLPGCTPLLSQLIAGPLSPCGQPEDPVNGGRAGLFQNNLSPQ